MLRSLVIALTSTLLLTGCTFLYIRSFSVESTAPASCRSNREIFEGFRDFILARGNKPLPNRNAPDRVAFRANGMDTEYARAMRFDWEENIELLLTPEGSFRISVIRIVHHRRPFSEAQLRSIAEETEAAIRHATSCPVKVTLEPQAAL